MHITMNRELILALGLVVALGEGLTGLSQTASQGPRRSTPVIDRIAPATIVPGTSPQEVRVIGRDFQPRLTLQVTTPAGAVTEYRNGQILSPRESSFRVATVFETEGPYAFVVTNEDGGVSDPFTLIVRVVRKPPAPVIERIRPDELDRHPEPQNLTVDGRHFGPELRALVTDPMGMEVLDPIIRDQTPSSFTLNVRLETSGTYSLVVTTASGAVSNAATIVVR